MLVSNRRGFLLADSLITILVVCLSCILCFSTYEMMKHHESGYEEYLQRSNREIESILLEIGQCEGCAIENDEH